MKIEEREEIELLLFRNREIDPLTDCWNWTGNLDSHGYGQQTIDYKHYIVSRLSMYIFSGFDLDSPLCILHRDDRCNSKRCFNPLHLYEGDKHDNVMDSIARGTHRSGFSKGNIFQKSKTHCKNGHEYSPENTVVRKSGSGRMSRVCIICEKASKQKWYENSKRVSV